MFAMRSKTTARATAVLVAVAALMTSGGAVAAPQSPGGPRYTAGAAGAGDDYFPYSGNGGYDVQHYHLDITYTPPPPAPAPIEGRLDGVATIDFVATQDLDRFNLDLRGMDVRSLTVNGKSATELAPPTPGATVEGAAYWQVQDDGAAHLGAHGPAATEDQGSDRPSRSSSSTAARRFVPRTSKRRSTGG